MCRVSCVVEGQLWHCTVALDSILQRTAYRVVVPPRAVLLLPNTQGASTIRV